MGYAVVHMQKFKAGGVRGIQSHNNREHPPKTNPDIEPSRTAQNYDLIYSENYARSVKGAIENFATETKTVRKDAVVYCSFIVTSDEQTMKAMTPEQQRTFFEDSVKWFADRYGGENIVNATVHMDETTPHMHVGVVPITADRLSAKTLFDKKELISIQTDFAKQVGERYGLERGKEGSERTHLTETRFKLQTAEQSLERAAAEYDRIRTTAADMGDKEKERIKTLMQERKALEGQIEALQADLRSRQLNIREVLEIKPERGLMGAVKGVTVSDIENLKATAIKGLEAKEQLVRLSGDYERIKKHVPTMQDRIQRGKEISRLKELETAFQRLPESVQKQLFPTKSHVQDRGRER